MRIPLLMLALLSGCSVMETEAERGYSQNGLWHQTGAVYTTADVRMVTERQHPVLNQWVVCTEPSPDVAKALATALELSAKSQTVGGSLSASSSEAVAELAGRSTALLGLRDGLFKACEAYANGIIGDDAYALVLSRYGQLMTTLFLGQDLSSGTARTATAMANPAANAPSSDSGAQNATGTGQGSQNKGGAGAPSGAASAAPPNATAIRETSWHPEEAMLAAVSVGAHDPAAVAPGAPAPSPPAAGAGHSPAPRPQSASSTKPRPAPNTTPNPGGADASVGNALVQMNHDYLYLDGNLSHLIVVACIDEGDRTRLAVARNRTNTWLQQICEDPRLKDRIFANLIGQTSASIK